MKNTNEPSPLILGRSYFRLRNYDKALEFLSQAVMAGKGNAAKDLYDLGVYFYNEGDYGKAEKAFQTLADRGHGESCLRLGMMCEEGKGRPRDVEAAFGYYSESFNQGVGMGAYRAGKIMFLDALDMTEVRDIAITWFEEAINAGIVEAYSAIGDLYSSEFAMGRTIKNDHTAFTWYMKGAMNHDHASMERAATSLRWGYGVPKDKKRAISLYEQAAASGDYLAALQLGDMYETGEGAPKDRRRAMELYLKAYELEEPTATSRAGGKLLLAIQSFFRTDLDQKTADFLDGYLKVLRERKYGLAFGLSAELCRRMGQMKLYETYIKEGMEAGDESCRNMWVQLHMHRAYECFNVLQPMLEELPKKRKQKKFFETYLKLLRETEACCLQAGESGETAAWQILAFLYLYYGKDMDATETDFLEAAQNGRGGRLFDMDYFLWVYYDGLEAVAPESLHQENPKKAFTFAQKMARKKNEDFYGVLAEYYHIGYGVKQSDKMAERWAIKAEEAGL